MDKPSEPKPGKFGGFILSIRYFIFPEFPGRVQEGARSGTGGGAAWNSSVELLGRTLSCGAPRLCAGGTKADCSPAGSLPREGGERGKGTGTPGVPCSSSCPPLGSAGKAPGASVVFFLFGNLGKEGMSGALRSSRNQRISLRRSSCVGSEPRHLNSLPGLWGMHFWPVHHRPGAFPPLKPVRSPPGAVLFSFPAPLSSFIQPIHCK